MFIKRLVKKIRAPHPKLKIIIAGDGLYSKQPFAERQEAEITVIEEEWGRPVDPERVAAALKQKAYKLVAMVHAETSTGVRQPIEDIARLAKETGTMMMLDTASSLGGIKVKLDIGGGFGRNTSVVSAERFLFFRSCTGYLHSTYLSQSVVPAI